MFSLDQLTEEDVLSLTDAQLFARGRILYQSGAVRDRYLADETDLDAGVQEGNRMYAVQAYLEEEELFSDCDCRDARRGTCSHAVALLLAWIHEPHSFTREGLFDSNDEWDLPEDELPGDPALGSSSAAPAGVLPFGAFVVRPVEPEREYVSSLSALPVPQLRDLAQRFDLPTGGKTREAFVKPLAQLLSQRDTVARSWSQLSRPAQKLLGVMALLRVNNLIYPQQARQAFQVLAGKSVGNFEALLNELSRLGLIFTTSYGASSVPSSLPFNLPPDADFGPQPADHARLRPHAAPPAPLDFASMVTRLVLVLKAGPDRFVARRLSAPQPLDPQVLRLNGRSLYPADPQTPQSRPNSLAARSADVPPAPSPLTDESRDDLSRAVGAKPDQMDFALRLLIHLGIIKPRPGQPLAVLAGGFDDFLAQLPLARALALFSAYANLTSWTELDRLQALHHPAPHLQYLGNWAFGQSDVTLLSAFALARSLLLAMLRRAPLDRWIDLAAFVKQAHAFHANPHVWPLNRGLYLELNGRVPNTANVQDWQDTYEPYVETILTGPLWWQGAVELAYRLDRVVAFRFTPLGAYLFGQNLDYVLPRSQAAHPQSAVKFLPTGDLLLQVEAASAELLGLLTQVCEARSDPAGQLLYRLSPAGVSRLLEAGWEVDQLIGALQQTLGPAVPPAWIATIREWARNFGTLHLYADVAVIELADDYALTELLAGTSLAQHLLYRFSPRLIAVRAEGLETLQAELVRKGYTPKTLATRS